MRVRKKREEQGREKGIGRENVKDGKEIIGGSSIE